MKARISLVLILAACVALGGLSAPSVAGAPGKKCSYETQTCLDYLVKKMQGQGWLGIKYDNAPGPDYMRLFRVVPGSPAEAAEFLAGDILVSINGAKFADNTEDECVTCSAMKNLWKPGAKVEYVVDRDPRHPAFRRHGDDDRDAHARARQPRIRRQVKGTRRDLEYYE